MSVLRISRQAYALRPFAIRTTPRLAFTNSRSSHSDYGSNGQGQPEGGKNPSEDKEHPGPPAPKTGKDSSSQQQQGGQQQSGQSQQQQPSSTSGSKGTQGAQPKILSESPPSAADEPEDVAKHNREMDARAERANEKVSAEDVEKDKVGKGFWSGTGGRDQQA